MGLPSSITTSFKEEMLCKWFLLYLEGKTRKLLREFGILLSWKIWLVKMTRYSMTKWYILNMSKQPMPT